MKTSSQRVYSVGVRTLTLKRIRTFVNGSVHRSQFPIAWMTATLKSQLPQPPPLSHRTATEAA